MKTEKPSVAITELLNRIGGEDDREKLFRAIYDDLHATARKLLQREKPYHTLCPTDLIGESYSKLFNNRNWNVEDRNHFYSIAAYAMRQILIDHARSKKRLKRNGIQITLSGAEGGKSDQLNALDILEIENALAHLEHIDPRQARLVELKFYAGLSTEEIASLMNISESTVKREWSTAKLFLKAHLKS